MSGRARRPAAAAWPTTRSWSTVPASQVGTGGYEVRGNEVTGTDAEPADARRRDRGAHLASATCAVPPGSRATACATSAATASARSPRSATLEVVRQPDRAGVARDRDGRARRAPRSPRSPTTPSPMSGPARRDEVVGVLGIQVTGAGRASMESNTVHGVGAAREVGGELGRDRCARQPRDPRRRQLRRPDRLPRVRRRGDRHRGPGAHPPAARSTATPRAVSRSRSTTTIPPRSTGCWSAPTCDIEERAVPSAQGCRG